MQLELRKAGKANICKAMESKEMQEGGLALF
jgi:hypothetical protein